MGKGIAGLETAYQGLLTAVLIALAVLVILCLLRAIIGPRTADRIVSVNMMGTMVIVIIAILAVMLGEGYLADICIIYAMISFLAVIVLTKVYMGVYMEKKEAGEKTDIGEGTESGEERAAGKEAEISEERAAVKEAEVSEERAAGKEAEISEERAVGKGAGTGGKTTEGERIKTGRETAAEEKTETGITEGGQEVRHGGGRMD